MKNDLLVLAQLVKVHGYTTTKRALVHLLMVSIYLRETGNVPMLQELREYWNSSERTMDREAAAWRTVMAGADVGEVARTVVASGALDDLGDLPTEAGALLLPRFLVA